MSSFDKFLFCAISFIIAKFLSCIFLAETIFYFTSFLFRCFRCIFLKYFRKSNQFIPFALFEYHI